MKQDIDELTKDLERSLETFKKLQEIAKAAGVFETQEQASAKKQFEVATAFVEHLCLKIRTNTRHTWDKVAIFEYVRNQYKDFLINAVKEKK